MNLIEQTRKYIGNTKNKLIFPVFVDKIISYITDDLIKQWGTRNPIDGDTWFFSFITHISVQSVFSKRL